MNSLKTKIQILLVVIGVIAFISGIVLLARQQRAAQESEAMLASMQAQAESREQEARSSTETSEISDVKEDASSDNEQSEVTSDEVVETAPESPVLVTNPYIDSFLANDHMVGWLKIEGTVIDYPVMWTPEDENFYLYKNFEGREDKNGSLLLDTDSSLNPLTTNLIIHGHNMRSGAMFGTLTDYEDPEYCKEHNIITLYTEEFERRYEVVAVFRSQVYRKKDQVFKFYKFFQADTQEEFDDFYNNIKALSLYDTGVTAQFGDHFITLSTCVYHVEQGRFVVVAKEIDPGDAYAPFREQDTTQEQNTTN